MKILFPFALMRKLAWPSHFTFMTIVCIVVF